MRWSVLSHPLPIIIVYRLRHNFAARHECWMETENKKIFFVCFAKPSESPFFVFFVISSLRRAPPASKPVIETNAAKTVYWAEWRYNCSNGSSPSSLDPSNMSEWQKWNTFSRPEIKRQAGGRWHVDLLVVNNLGLMRLNAQRGRAQDSGGKTLFRQCNVGFWQSDENFGCWSLAQTKFAIYSCFIRCRAQFRVEKVWVIHARLLGALYSDVPELSSFYVSNIVFARTSQYVLSNGPKTAAKRTTTTTTTKMLDECVAVKEKRSQVR